jgi:hypothetical protein
MAVLNSLQVASGSLADLGVVEEVSLGQRPVNAALSTVRRRSTSIGLSKDQYQSEEIRGDRQTSDVRHGIRRAGGDLVTEVSPGAHANFMEALLGAFWEQPVPIDASDVNLTATLVGDLLEVTATSFDFIAAGMTVGASVTFTATGTSYLNGKLFSVVSHATNKVRLLPAIDNFVLASPASLTTGTFHIKGARVRMWNIPRSFTFERAFTDIGKFQELNGLRVNTMAVDLPATGIATATYGFLGTDAQALTLTSIDGVAEILLDDSDLTSLTFNAAAGTITAGAGNFLTAGFVPGDRVQFSGDGITDEQNRNVRTIIDVTATVLTVAEAIQSGGPYTDDYEVLRVGLPRYTEAPSENVLVAASGVLLVNGVPAGTVTNMSFTVDNQMAGTEVVGSNATAAIGFGVRCAISGSLTVLFDVGGAGETLYDAFDLEEDVSIVMRLDTSDKTGGIAFVLPRVKVSGGNMGDAASDVPISMDFAAAKPFTANPELGDSQIYIYDTSMTGEEPIVDPVVLTWVSEGSSGLQNFTVTGGVAPYSFDADNGGGAGDAVVMKAGAFTFTYAADGDYDPVITDSSSPAKSDTVNVDVTTAT